VAVIGNGSAEGPGDLVVSALATAVGSVALRSPVMTASGTAGHGAELGAYGRLDELGAVVVKSLAAYPWPGNPGLRVHGIGGGSMVNSVGLQGPGVEAWREDDLPALVASGAAVVASIWGRTVEEYETAAAALAGAPGVVALEVNVSCPNVEDRSRMFAHSGTATSEAIEAAGAARLPRWAKLSPNVGDLCEIASAALGAGAEALTLVNTSLGMALDPDGSGEGGRAGGRRGHRHGQRHGHRHGQGPDADRLAPAAFAGGLSGPALHPVALRAVFDCRQAFPEAAIVGVGGVESAREARAFLAAGANAVQVGTAIFADPRAPWKVQAELAAWCDRHGVTVKEMIGAAVR
jgi:dihydroorotate dehydrogenase (NAD+) catalytic subunit